MPVRLAETVGRDSDAVGFAREESLASFLFPDFLSSVLLIPVEEWFVGFATAGPGDSIAGASSEWGADELND